MKFYLDFEAAQYTERITSIGCICENGEMFKTYVKLPEGEEVGKQVSELTHLTTEFLNEHGVTADEAFNNFYTWVRIQGDDIPTYYVYGNSDKHFIERTMRKMSDLTALTFASSIIYFMEDYSKVVRDYYGVSLGLNKLYCLMKQKEAEQKHDALEDAVMLSYIIENLETITIDEMPEEIVKKREKQIKEKELEDRKNKILSYYRKWENKRRYQTAQSTGGNARDWNYCVYKVCEDKKNVFYFKDFDALVAWAIKFNLSGYAITKSTNILRVIDILQQTMNKEVPIFENYYYIKNKENNN